jgi:hypothetical protein
MIVFIPLFSPAFPADVYYMFSYHTIKFYFCGILFLCFFPLFAQNGGPLKDDSALRLLIKESWLTAESGAVLKNKPFIYELPSGGPVQVRAELQGGEFSVILARERNGAFPGWAAGSWILTRPVLSGGAGRIRVFLSGDPQVYVQFRPMGESAGSGEKSLLDAVIYGAYVVRGLPLGIPFDRLLTLPVEEALAAAGDKFPAPYFNPDPRLYRDMRIFTAKVRAALPGLKFRDDGALDEEGRYVYIRDLSPQEEGGGGLNCSGFAKWIVDGILYPLTRRRLAIPPLKEPSGPRTSSLSANLEELEDPYFGLDWTRNLAVEAARVYRGQALSRVEELEVRRDAFGAVIDRTRGSAYAKGYPGFLPNAGFSMEGLRPLLYTLAVNEPGRIYLASINKETANPRIRRHYHIAVLVPYFSENGTFRIVVFESAAETAAAEAGFAEFLGRHPGAMVNLVRVPVEGAFYER